jgi:AcrR family transcriptional regulator
VTEKQEKILRVALKLFAAKGYDGTSTSKIAQVAKVSEGLIFRHFKNKEGLLNAILDQGKNKAQKMYLDILDHKDPKKIIASVITFPFTIDPNEFSYWKLMYALKWQTDVYDNTATIPIKNILITAFKDLNYEDPNAEAELVLILLDGIATNVLLKKNTELTNVQTALLKKYKL